MNERPVAIVTGSAVGIGRALSIGFARRGYCVVGFDIDAAGNAKTADFVGDAMAATTCDIGDSAAVKIAIDGVVERTGRVDVLINNAALWNDTTLTGGSYEEQVGAFRKAIDSCAMGTFHCTAAAVSAMGPGANVVNLITEHIRPERHITGSVGTGYDSAKFAQWRLTESWAKELASKGIRVNGLAFGATDTPMLRAVSPTIAENGMRAEDVVDAVFLVIDHGPDGPTGQVYDFGFTGTPREESLRQIQRIRATN
jgi:NAD(P)-dependent dehydrogenase (short-subunit alcohol dehydrogenase family)